MNKNIFIIALLGLLCLGCDTNPGYFEITDTAWSNTAWSNNIPHQRFKMIYGEKFRVDTGNNITVMILSETNELYDVMVITSDSGGITTTIIPKPGKQLEK